MKPANVARDEIDILLSMRHPNVIRLWDFYETDDGLFIVMDLCPGGELFDNIVRRVSFKEMDAQIIMRHLLTGVAYLHERGVVHRDLKPENILLYDKDDISKGMVISDFGLAKIMPNEGLLLTACGSPEYVAPEVLLGEGYDMRVDMWSCGVIAFALLCGYTPFHSPDVHETLQKAVNMEFEFHPTYWSTQSEECKDFICKCLCEKNSRITCVEALDHPWLTHLSEKQEKNGLGPDLKRVHPSELENKDTRKGTLLVQLEGLEELQRVRKRMRVLSDDQLDEMDAFIREFKIQIKSPLGSPTDVEKSIQEEWTSGSHNASCNVEVHAKDSDKKPRSKESSEEGGMSYTRHYIRESSSQQHQIKHTSSTVEALNKMLEQYGTDTLPTLSRVDPTADVKPQETMTFSKALKAVPALVSQGFSIGSAIASHVIYGPPKKSWGVEMSILTRMIREIAERHTSLATISGLQRSVELLRFLPIPEDGLVTPVTFRAKRRNLRGFLAEEDAKETGKRELTGEWIVGKQTWRRLQTEWQSGNRTRTERVILYIHGGAYFVMSASTHRPLTIALSKFCECRVFSVNYRLAPDTIFPGALLDAVYAYFRLTEDLHIPPNNIVLAADSAGGGLAIALMMYLRDNKYPLPAGAILMSPWVDLTLSCDSWETNKEFDYLPRPGAGNHMNPINAYLGPNMDKYLMHPYVSPLFGDMHGLPPMLIQSGDAEVLRDEAVLFAHKCSLAGVPVRHEIYEDCVHVFQFFLFLEASRKAFQSMRHFMRTVLDKKQKRRASLVSEDTREQLDSEMSGGQGETAANEPGSPNAFQHRAEDLDQGDTPHHTLKGLGPNEDEEDDETWDLDGDDENPTQVLMEVDDQKENPTQSS